MRINTYIWISILVNLTLPNNQSFKVKSVFKSHDNVSNSETIKKLILLAIRKSISYVFLF